MLKTFAATCLAAITCGLEVDSSISAELPRELYEIIDEIGDLYDSHDDHHHHSHHHKAEAPRNYEYSNQQFPAAPRHTPAHTFSYFDEYL